MQTASLYSNLNTQTAACKQEYVGYSRRVTTYRSQQSQRYRMRAMTQWRLEEGEITSWNIAVCLVSLSVSSLLLHFPSSPPGV